MASSFFPGEKRALRVQRTQSAPQAPHALHLRPISTDSTAETHGRAKRKLQLERHVAFVHAGVRPRPAAVDVSLACSSQLRRAKWTTSTRQRVRTAADWA